MELKNLMDKREELRPKQLVVAMKDSDRTFDEILNFIRK